MGEVGFLRSDQLQTVLRDPGLRLDTAQLDVVACKFCEACPSRLSGRAAQAATSASADPEQLHRERRCTGFLRRVRSARRTITLGVFCAPRGRQRRN
jgi:hypothetical protein